MVKPEDCEEIIQSHIIDGKIVERLLCKDVDGKIVNKLDDLTFYKKQKRIALKNCGVINPEDIDEYIAFDGYKALEKVLLEMIPDEVIKTIEENRNTEYEFDLDEDIELKDQELLPETKAILFNLFRDYLSTAEQKEKIIKMQVV